tara:strand:- start:1652 stop:1828 length:177 start_codon:yes stop_codon:yes gene_type:complete
MPLARCNQGNPFLHVITAICWISPVATGRYQNNAEQKAFYGGGKPAVFPFVCFQLKYG